MSEQQTKGLMTVVNLLPARVFTNEHVGQLKSITGKIISHVYKPVLEDSSLPMKERVNSLLDNLNYSPEQWTSEILLVLPLDPVFAAAVVAKIYARYEVYPVMVHVKVNDSYTLAMKVVELVDLNELPDETEKKHTIFK